MDTYEKKYKDALERAREWYNNSNSSSIGKSYLYAVFPELAESEDEKMWKLIKKYAHYNISDLALEADHITREHLESWLEKQGEKPQGKSALEAINEVEGGNRYGVNDTPYNYEHATIAQKDFAPKIESKFKIGDWVVTSYGKVNQVVSVDKDGDGYTLDDDTYFSGSWCNMYHLWTIADAKDGDVLHSPSHRLIWFYKDNKHYHTCINMNYVTENIAIDGLIEIPSDVCPATTVQRSILFSKMEGAGYEWNSKKRKLKKISQRMISAWAKEAMYNKPTDNDMVEALRTEYEKGRADAFAEMQKEWSEDDEKRLQSCINILKAKSLSALLDVLSSSTLDSSNDHYYRLHCMEQFTGWHENPIDTCYEMIVGLHGLKML